MPAFEMTESSVSVPRNTANPVTTATVSAVKKRNSRSAIALPSTEPKASRSRSNSFTPTLTGTLIALRSSSHSLAWWTVSSAHARVRATRLGSRSDESSTG